MMHERNTSLTVSTFCSKTGISRQTLNKHFDRHICKTPSQFKKILRLDVAQPRLRCGRRFIDCQEDHAEIFGLDPNAKQQRLKYEVAPGLSIDSPVMVTDMIMDGNLGQPFMSRYVITFDLAHSRLWLVKPSLDRLTVSAAADAPA
jgi:AraC-like DNA-binding protein